MAGILSPITASPVAKDDAIRFVLKAPVVGQTLTVTLWIVVKDQDGSSRRRELISVIADPINEIGGFGFAPYTCALSSHIDGVEVEVSRQDGTREGWLAGTFDVLAEAVDLDGVTTDFTSGSLSFTVSNPPALAWNDPGEIGPSDPVDVVITSIDVEDVVIGVLFGSTEFADPNDFARAEWISIGGVTLPPYTVVDQGGGVLRITRAGGWPARMVAIATAQGEFVETAILGIMVSPEAGLDPGGSPETSNVTPAPGTAISATTPVSVDVTDDSGVLRRAMLLVAYSSGPLAGVTELAHDGDAFVGYYSAGCSRTPIDGGFRFTLIRDGGWPASPTLRVFAFDRGGNEV